MSIRSLSGSSPAEVLEYVFSIALPEVPDAKPGDVREKYVLLQSGWGAQVLAEGTVEYIRRIVLANLEWISQRPDFGSFDVQARLDVPPSVQVNGLIVDRTGSTVAAAPLRVWRAGDTYFACGNSDFNDSGA